MSANGTWLNDARVTTALLTHHDVVRLGGVELLFLPDHEDARAALRARGDRGRKVTVLPTVSPLTRQPRSWSNPARAP